MTEMKVDILISPPQLFDLRNLKEEMQTFRGHKKEASAVRSLRMFLELDTALVI